MTWKPIVAGVDSSPEGLRAALRALDLARAANTRCFLVHAVRDPVTALAFSEDHFDLREHGQALLDSARTILVETLRGEVPAAAFELEVRFGPPAVVVSAVADERDAELVVLGGKHHAGLGRWLAGSTVQHMIRIHDRPILVTADGVGQSGFRRVLAAVDLSPAARPTIAGAERLAGLFHAELRLIHVIEPMPGLPDYPVGLHQVLITRSEEELSRAVWPQVQFPNAEKLVRRGPVTETIAAAAHEWQADLVVVGSHGMGWVDRVLIGSVTERLLNRLPASLVVMPVPTTSPSPQKRIQRRPRGASASEKVRA